MASIDFDGLKAANKIEDVIGQMGRFTLDGRGRHMKGVAHDSFTVDVDKQYYFWNSKGRGGSVFDYLVNEHGMDEMEAWRWLGDRAGRPIEVDERTRARLVAERRRTDVLTAVQGWFVRVLLGDGHPPQPSPEGRGSVLSWDEVVAAGGSRAGADYCVSRGWDVATAWREGLGWWDGDWQGLKDWLGLKGVALDDPVTVAFLGWRGDVRRWGAEKGVRVDGRWIEKGRVPGLWRSDVGWLMYSVMEGPRCVYVAGRNGDVEERKFKHWKPDAGLVGVQRPFWNSAVDRSSDYVVVVEGQADVVTLGMWGVPGVAIGGLAVPDGLEKMLKGFKLVFVGADGDGAGVEALGKERPLGRLVRALGPMTRIVRWPEATKDVNGWLVEGGGDARGCELRLERAQRFVLWLASRAKLVAGVGAKEEARKEALAVAAVLGDGDLALVRDVLLDGDHLGMSVGAFNMARKPLRLAARRAALAEGGLRQAQPTTGEGGEDDVMLMGKLRGEPADHEGHAQCLLALYPNRFSFVAEWGWMFFNGTHWVRGGAEAAVERACTDVLRRRQRVAGDPDSVLFKASGGSHQNVVGTRLQLQSLVTLTTEDFDCSPDLLNVGNGVLDLRTGELAAHDGGGERFTYCLETEYDPEADDVEWLAFLYGAVRRDHDDGVLVDWLQECVGYWLTGHTREDAFWYLYGPSRSGKGTFTNTLLTLLGRPLSNSVNISTFTADRGNDTQNFDLAPLKAAHLVIASETERHKRLQATNLKQMTGEDYLWCSYKGKDHFSYLPMFKILMASNFPLNMDADDHAAWARARVVEFPHSNVGREDRGLKKRLAGDEVLRGVLAWAVRGAMRWYERGRLASVPQRVAELTGTHREDQDLVMVWMDEVMEVCDVGRDDVFTPTDLLMVDYQAWCKRSGVRPKGIAAFKQSLAEKGFLAPPGSGKRRHWKYDNPRAGFCGLQIASDVPPEDHASQGGLSL